MYIKCLWCVSAPGIWKCNRWTLLFLFQFQLNQVLWGNFVHILLFPAVSLIMLPRSFCGTSLRTGTWVTHHSSFHSIVRGMVDEHGWDVHQSSATCKWWENGQLKFLPRLSYDMSRTTGTWWRQVKYQWTQNVTKSAATFQLFLLPLQGEISIS